MQKLRQVEHGERKYGQSQLYDETLKKLPALQADSETFKPKKDEGNTL